MKQCGIKKKEEQLVLAILSNIGPNYSVFISAFHATKLTAWNWKMLKLAYFMESLTQEKDKFVMMGTIKPSKYQDLVAGDSRVDSKSNKKDKNPPEQKRDKNKSQEEPQGSKNRVPKEEEQRRNEQVWILQ